jgi:hypothetical protein
VLVDLLHPLHGPLPLRIRRRIGHHLANLARDDRDLVALELLDHRHRVLDVLDRLLPRLLVAGDHVAALDHECDRPPAPNPVLIQDPLHVLGVVDVRLAAYLDALVAVFREAPDRRLDRLRTHPVVH